MASCVPIEPPVDDDEGQAGCKHEKVPTDDGRVPHEAVGGPLGPPPGADGWGGGWFSHDDVHKQQTHPLL